jgi:hypothetical protein
MKTIGDLLARDLTKKIVEVIQVDQDKDEDLYSEITEYIATDSIKEQYATLLKAIAEAPADPHDSMGVWISGFFGSGKSSFAKNLGNALQNDEIMGQHYATLFKKQIDSPQVTNLIDSITARIPTEVILFEVAKERDTRKVTERIAELIYTVLLRELGYAEDFDIAELEIELEQEGKLDAFVAKCDELYAEGWKKVRKGAQKVSRASRVLHEIDPGTYQTPDSWAHTQKTRENAITVKTVVERTFELVSRRRPGKAIVFIIDEVGQHVARSGDKIEDLRATVEEFGKVGRNLVKNRKAPAPCWIIVTSQEKLDEVVAAIDSKRIRLATMQDRFRWRVDLAPSDIREVATKRVLAKKPEAESDLRKLFNENPASLNASLRLERTSRKTDVEEDDFVLFYPYPPHYIDLCIGIMSGVRLQPGAPRHYGGSNRTIIKQAYEMLVSDRTALAKQPVGRLVTLDKVFELVEGNLSNEKRTDIHEISERFKGDAEDGGWAQRVAKVVCLLEFIRDLPRTEKNIAAFLIDEVGQASPVAEVESACKRLYDAQFIRNTEEGWKLQTAQEKNWETERRGHLEPKPRERNEITRSVLREIYGEPSFRTYRHKDFRTFRLGLTVEGSQLDEGDLPINVCVADDNDDMPTRITAVRDDSRQSAHENDIYWVFALNPDIDDLVAQLHASRKMVEKYDQLRAQNKITPDEATCLQDEKNAVLGYQNRLRSKMVDALEQGTALFRGVSWDGADLGKSLGEIIKKLMVKVVPDLYPKLELGARPIDKGHAELVLKTVDLKALPDVFYAGEKGLGLVIKEGQKLVPNPNAEVCKEVYSFLASEQEYGNKETRTGKSLERRFSGTPYGWELDMLRLLLATLFRAGTIEATYQGSRYHNYQDPLCRKIFTNTPAFRASLFSLRSGGPSIKELTDAVQKLEDLNGEEVDVEEGVIATAFKKIASEEMEMLLPLKALAEAHKLPIQGLVTDYQQTLTGIQSSSSDDCVRILNQTGDIFQETREKVRELRTKLDDKAIDLIRQARRVVYELGPKLSGHPLFTEVEHHLGKLQSLLGTEEVIDQLDAVGEHTKTMADSYRSAYISLFDSRHEAYEKAVEAIRNRPEWTDDIDEAKANTILAPLQSRLGKEEDRQKVAEGKSLGTSTLGEMESDIAAADGLKAAALAKIQEMTVKKGTDATVRRVRVAELYDRPIQTKDDLDNALEKLRDALQKLIDEGNAIILE